MLYIYIYHNNRSIHIDSCFLPKLLIQAQRAALNQYDELLKRVAERDPSAVQEAVPDDSAGGH